jgi:hypothetical protein
MIKKAKNYPISRFSMLTRGLIPNYDEKMLFFGFFLIFLIKKTMVGL